MRHMHATAFALMALVTQPAQTAQTASSVKTLEWMTGCWVARDGKTSSWESWTRASDEVMFGVSYTLGRTGKVQEFEFLRVVVRRGRLVYLAQPNGRPATAFDLEPGANAREAVFANPAHDFPKRVAYRATPTGLFAWIDGGDAAPGRRIEFPMTRVSCDSAPR
jgi:hypothetical protein